MCTLLESDRRSRSASGQSSKPESEVILDIDRAGTSLGAVSICPTCTPDAATSVASQKGSHIFIPVGISIIERVNLCLPENGLHRGVLIQKSVLVLGFM